ncbi:MAG TPA: phosphoenolpyruvate--protein phosphotransferase [Anaeromyxobacter sp.]|nr:phosphoenolpyruvate--protein phosphotransferase [Anaeromyxobacter sp.]
MIGLVIVSHSARLAEGVAELLRGLGGAEVPVATAGGLSGPGSPLGTDAVRVAEAIERVCFEDGVLVLMDLGSAVLSAETALDLLPEGLRGRVVLCEAPLVEGAVAAAIEARQGSPLAQVAAEARGALAHKRDQLGAPPEQPAPTRASPTGAGEPLPLRITVQNRLGLHARPAAQLVLTAARFGGAEVKVKNETSGRGPVSARSVNGVMALGARSGDELLFLAQGPQAREALEALRALADSGFGDEEGTAAPRAGAIPVPELPRPEPAAERALAGAPLRGIPVSPGLAVGPARQLRWREAEPEGEAKGDPQAEWARLEGALRAAERDLRLTREELARRAKPGAAAILDAHLLFFEDEALLGPARAAILGERLDAAAAWRRSFEQVAAEMGALEDPYLRARAGDVREVGRQVLLHLGGRGGALELPAEPGILVAPDLGAAEAARLDPERVLGIAIARGSATGHGAILARALGIPAVAGAGPALLLVKDSALLVLDGSAGLIFTEPGPEEVARARRGAEREHAAQQAARISAAGPAVTRDGRRVAVVANVGSLAEARAAVAGGAEGVGVLRTEFLFQGRRSAPDEEEQLAAYRAIAEVLSGRPLVVRTLDAGGDKPLSYLGLAREANPNLGWRAIRPCLADPAFFRVQLRAIVRAAAEFPVRVLFPMIATLEEWRTARTLLEEARAEVLSSGRRAPERIEAGIMVEIPAAALEVERFAAEVDFLSIGTNDLVQYTMAAERGNPRLSALSDPCEPAVLTLIARVSSASQAARKRADVCGEMAADPQIVPLLVGLGIDELSVSAPAVPEVKKVVRGLAATAARSLSEEALSLDSAAAVRKLLSRFAGTAAPAGP